MKKAVLFIFGLLSCLCVYGESLISVNDEEEWAANWSLYGQKPFNNEDISQNNMLSFEGNVNKGSIVLMESYFENKIIPKVKIRCIEKGKVKFEEIFENLEVYSYNESGQVGAIPDSDGKIYFTLSYKKRTMVFYENGKEIKRINVNYENEGKNKEQK